MNAWSPHPLDSWGQRNLLEIAHSAAPPDENPDWWGEVTLPARDGWQVCFFYDCGELDYIDHFISPGGERLDVFVNGYQSEQSPPVMNWRSCSDTHRLLESTRDDDKAGSGPAAIVTHWRSTQADA